MRRIQARVAALLPSWRDYKEVPRTWRRDLIAGVTVGIVALPLALAFGVSSGAGAEAGLITAIVAGIVAAVFGGSNVQVSGPTGAMVVVLAPIVASHGIAALTIVSVFAGIIVIAAGVLRLGQAVSLIPWPVIEGFTLGIAVIIFMQQVPNAVGSSAGSHPNALVDAVLAVVAADPATAALAIGITAVVAAIMIVAPRLHPSLPGSIVAIVIVTIVVVLFSLPAASIGKLPASLPMPGLPQASPDLLLALAGPAMTVAALAAIESLLSARVASAVSDTGQYDADRELVGQGLASIAAGLFGGMPATGAIARTAVNIRSGARTRLAALTHAALLIGIVYLASGAVSAIPLAALSGVLMVTAARMVPLRTVGIILKSNRSTAAVFTLTALITVSVDLIYAVLIGVVVAAFFTLRALAHTGGVHREALPTPSAPGDSRIALLRLDGAIFFGAAERVLRSVERVDGVSVVILRMSQVQYLDATGAQALTELVGHLERRGITVLIKGIRPTQLRLANRVGVIDSLRTHEHLFRSLAGAVEHARSHVQRESAKLTG